MATLVAGILAFLPLEFLLQHGKLAGQVVQLRLRYVNQLSTEEFMRFKYQAGSFLEDIDVYVKLCTYQGELSSEDVLYLSAGTCLYRALLLGDVQAYERLINVVHPHELLEKKGWLLQLALESGNVRVQALTLARFESLPLFGEDDRKTISELQDPASVPWTPQLRAYYVAKVRKLLTLDHFVEWPDLRGATLAGYCQAYSPGEFLSAVPAQTRVNTRQAFLSGWTSAELQKYPFGRQPAIPELELVPREYMAGLLKAGYVPPTLPAYAVGTYLHQVRPSALYQVLSAGISTSKAVYGFTTEKLSTDFLRRCRAMLAVLARFPLEDSPMAREYLAFLQIMAGQALPQIPDSLWQQAALVAHPDLQSKAGEVVSEGLLQLSNTKYDLSHLIKVASFDLPSLQENLWLFQAYGCLYQLLTEKKLFAELQRLREVQGYDQGNPLLQDYPAKPAPGPQNTMTDATLPLLRKLQKYDRALPKSPILTNTGWWSPVAVALGLNQKEYDAANLRATGFRSLVTEIERQLQ